ncbi:winged helix-turn-helix transcriptional regulator [Gordonia effusa]|nr:helix-turn-helix domain-containing protein [Gordonia effusa]
MDSNAGKKGARPRTDKVVQDWSTSCTAEITVAILGGAWKPTILHELEQHAVLRFGELSRMVGGPSPRVLTKQLRELEHDGLISRTVYPEVPPRVEYQLTDVGKSAQTLLQSMTDWGRQYSQWHTSRET